MCVCYVCVDVCALARSRMCPNLSVVEWIFWCIFCLDVCVCVHVYNVNEIESEGEEKRKMTGIE